MTYATVLFKYANGKYGAFTIGTPTALYTESSAQAYAIGGGGRRDIVWSKVIIDGMVTFQVGDTSIL